MKKLVFVGILLFLAILPYVNSKTTTFDGDGGTLTVHPETVYNPHLQYQYINITTKKDDEFKFFMDFYKEINWLIIEEYNNGWQDITADFTKEKKDGKDKYTLKNLKEMLDGEQHLFRIKYKPFEPRGKWDLVLQDKDNNLDVLDPWWVGETNLTQGFVYGTNHSFSDQFEPSYNLSTRWNITNTSVVSITNETNGFGYPTQMLTIDEPTLNFNYIIANTTMFENYEVIIKTKKSGDYGTDYCGFSLSRNPTTNTNFLRYRINQNLYITDDDGNLLRPALQFLINETVYFRSVVNNSFVSFYYSTDLEEPNKNWTLLFNYTEDTVNNNFMTGLVSVSGRQSKCHFELVLARELMPKYLPQGDYLASFIYDTANSSVWSKSEYRHFKGGTTTPYLINTFADNTPTDAEASAEYYTTSAGVWYFRVDVTGDGGNEARNYTQAMYVDVGHLNISVYDEVTDTLITGTDIYIELVGNSYAKNYTTNTGKLAVTNIPTGTYSIRYRATGYNKREFYSTVNLGLTTQANIYLLNSTLASLVILTLEDQNSDYFPNVTVKLQRNYVTNGSSSYKTISMTRTNFEGQAGLYVELYDVWYKMIYEYNGQILSVTTPSPFFTTAVSDVASAEEDDYYSWRNYDSVFYNLSFVNQSGVIYARFEYSDTTNLLREACLRVDRISSDGLDAVCYNCQTSVAGTLTCQINENLTGEYKAVALIDTNTTNSWYPVSVEWWKKITTPSFGLEGVFFTVIMAGTLGLMGIASITGSLLLLFIALVGAAVTSLLAGFGMSWIYYIFIFIMMIIFMVARRRQ